MGNWMINKIETMLSLSEFQITFSNNKGLCD